MIAVLFWFEVELWMLQLFGSSSSSFQRVELSLPRRTKQPLSIVTCYFFTARNIDLAELYFFEEQKSPTPP
jgi:hypothetical protein